MAEEVFSNVFRVEVPLPDNPLKSVNSYVIKGDERNLIIDTGMNREECLTALTTSLARLDVRLTDTDFFITHFHADHMGLVTTLAAEQSKVYYHQPEADFVNSFNEEGSLMKGITEFALRSGFPEEVVEESLKQHPAFRYNPPFYPNFTILAEGDNLCVGDYRFECVQTPGHTLGHMCLYERQKKLFVSGDHILQDISPNISSWSEGHNALKDYLESLDKVLELDVELVLPGHRRVFQDFRGRIEELKHHHQARLDEVLTIVQSGSKTVYEVASQMSWNFTAKWASFPVMQKWFATGEAATHLTYLKENGSIQRAKENNRILFSPKASVLGPSR